ncbi:MAG: hypothetical protein LBR31_01700 [Desulfovibrio sp.]|jgi:hypothetical protein|nr:hypothetical protein [Desulfovibrio sp.]
MVRIPDRPYAWLATNLPDARNAGASAVGSGEAFNIIARGMDRLAAIAGHIQEQRDHDLLVEAQNRYTRAMTEFSLGAEQTRTGAHARGFTKDYAGTADTTQADVLGWLKDNGGSGNTERAFGNWAAGRKTAGGADAARFEHGQLLAHSKDLFTQRLQGITDQLEQNPRAYGDAVGQLEEAFTLGVGQGLFRAEEAKARLHDAREKLGLTAFDNLYAMNRGEAINSMAAFGMSPAQQAKARKRFQADSRADAAQARAANAEKKAELASALPDILEVAQLTGDTSEAAKAAEALRKLGDVKTAERIDRKINVFQNNFAAIKESQAASMPELQESIARLDKDILGLQAEGAAADARRLEKLNAEMDIRRKIYAARANQIAADPMQAAMIGEQPEQITPEGVSRLMAKQRAIGKGVPGFTPQPMTKAQADTLNRQWFAEPDAGKQAALLQELRQSYGKHLPQALAQAKLPPALVAVAPIAGDMTPRQTATMIAAATAKDADLPKSDEQVKSSLENSEFLQAARDISGLMYRSSEARDFAAQTAKAWGNYARLGGDIVELEKNFLIINDGNLKVLAPKSMDAPGLEAGLNAATRILQAGVKKGDLSAQMRTVYANGCWLYDGAGGFAFVDAATGLAVTRKSLAEILDAGKDDDSSALYFGTGE